MGTFLIGVVAQVTGVANLGVAVIAVLLIVGFFVFCKADKMQR